MLCPKQCSMATLSSVYEDGGAENKVRAGRGRTTEEMSQDLRRHLKKLFFIPVSMGWTQENILKGERIQNACIERII